MRKWKHTHHCATNGCMYRVACSAPPEVDDTGAHCTAELDGAEFVCEECAEADDDGPDPLAHRDIGTQDRAFYRTFRDQYE